MFVVKGKVMCQVDFFFLFLFQVQVQYTNISYSRGKLCVHMIKVKGIRSHFVKFLTKHANNSVATSQ